MSGFVKSILLTVIIGIIVYAIMWNAMGRWPSDVFSICISMTAALMVGGFIVGIIIELRRLGWLTWNV